MRIAATDIRLNTIFRSIAMLSVPDDKVVANTEGAVTNPLPLPLPPPQQRGGGGGGSQQLHWLQTEHLFLGITSTDGSQVYYKLSNGIVKPPM